jgi:hypothetical protein
MLTSDPHAWLRQLYARLRVRPSFPQLAPSHQFAELCGQVAAEHPDKAAQMREWSPAARFDYDVDEIKSVRSKRIEEGSLDQVQSHVHPGWA